MSERPDGDAIDHELRRVMTDIASVPGPAPELDEFPAFLTTHEGARTMNTGTRIGLLVAAAAVLVAGLLLFVNNDDGLDTIESPAPTTTTTGGTPTDGPETSVAAVQPDSASEDDASSGPVTIDPATFAGWQEYESSTPDLIAADCAATYLLLRVGSSVGIQEWSFPTGRNDDFEYLLDKRIVGSWLPSFASYVRLRVALISEMDPGATEVLDRLTEELDVLRATIDSDGNEEVDLGPLMNEWWFGLLDVANQSCVFSKNRGITDAMANFSSDTPRFGGRGMEAANRCGSFTILRLLLEDIVKGSAIGATEARADDAFVLVESFWTDRPIDQAVVDLAARWQAIDVVDGFATSEQLLEVQGVLDDLLAYRASMPEGGILCPLDDGWEG